MKTFYVIFNKTAGATMAIKGGYNIPTPQRSDSVPMLFERQDAEEAVERLKEGRISETQHAGNMRYRDKEIAGQTKFVEKCKAIHAKLKSQKADRVILAFAKERAEQAQTELTYLKTCRDREEQEYLKDRARVISEYVLIPVHIKI